MVRKENLPTIAASKKRFALSTISSPIKPKRRALSELPSLSNIVHGPKTRSKTEKEEKKRSKPAPEEHSNIFNGEDDPQFCAPYAANILAYLRLMEREEKRRPMENYLEKAQKKIVTARMRAILVDWLVEVAEEYKLVSDTLYLAVSYVDIFLSCNSVDKQKLQLLGVSSVLIASKYEEIEPPNVEEFCYITDNTYTKKEVVPMETNILKFLNFEMGNPTVKSFLRNFINAGAEDKMNSSLQQQTGYRSSDLKDCIYALHNMQMNRKFSSLNAIRDKYKQPKFKAVSAMIAPSEIPLSYFEDFEEMI